MKKLFKSIVIVSLTILVLGLSNTAFAGNKDRTGQAGATELLINPWASSAGWSNAGMSSIHGVEAMWGNVAGITATNSIDLNFSYVNWLRGSDVNSYSFGFLARISESVVGGLYVMSFNPGEIERTTTENPDMTLGTFKPTLMNINVAVAKSFSNSIHAGFVFRACADAGAAKCCYCTADRLFILAVSARIDCCAESVCGYRFGRSGSFGCYNAVQSF